MDDYRSVVRTAAANAKKNLNVFLKESFGPLCTDDSEGRPVLTYDSFEVGYGRIKTAISKLTWKDLNAMRSSPPFLAKILTLLLSPVCGTSKNQFEDEGMPPVTEKI